MFPLFLIEIPFRMGVETRRLIKKANKNSPPILSHEFVIQNHGDITSVILMVVFLGFMWQVLSNLPFHSPNLPILLLCQVDLTAGEKSVIMSEEENVGRGELLTWERLGRRRRKSTELIGSLEEGKERERDGMKCCALNYRFRLTSQ